MTHDRLMIRLHDEHPGYNWRSNKGYGTPDHYSGLKTHGVTVHHRRSFAPIYNMLHGSQPDLAAIIDAEKTRLIAFAED